VSVGPRLGSPTVHPVWMCQHVPSHQAEDEEHNHSGHDPHRPHVGFFGIWLILLRHGDFLFARGRYRPWSHLNLFRLRQPYSNPPDCSQCRPIDGPDASSPDDGAKNTSSKLPPHLLLVRSMHAMELVECVALCRGGVAMCAPWNTNPTQRCTFGSSQNYVPSFCDGD